jgi:hypothetical protein
MYWGRQQHGGAIAHEAADDSQAVLRLSGSRPAGRRRGPRNLAASQPGRQRGIENLRGWLITIVARVSLNTLKSRNAGPRSRSARTCPTRSSAPTTASTRQKALLAGSVGLALLVVLDALAPAERLAFVLHDIFAVPFDPRESGAGWGRGGGESRPRPAPELVEP